MATQRQVRTLGDIARELDMVVYQLERDPEDGAAATQQRKRMRRDLERLRDQLTEVVRELE